MGHLYHGYVSHNQRVPLKKQLFPHLPHAQILARNFDSAPQRSRVEAGSRRHAGSLTTPPADSLEERSGFQMGVPQASSLDGLFHGKSE